MNIGKTIIIAIMVIGMIGHTVEMIIIEVKGRMFRNKFEGYKLINKILGVGLGMILAIALSSVIWLPGKIALSLAGMKINYTTGEREKIE